MIVIKVELHSANTGKVSTLAKMHISNDGTGTDTLGNYSGQTLRAPNFITAQRTGSVKNHKRKQLSVWVLIQKMLTDMGHC